jgi:hypothetical protein
MLSTALDTPPVLCGVALDIMAKGKNTMNNVGGFRLFPELSGASQGLDQPNRNADLPSILASHRRSARLPVVGGQEKISVIDQL